MDKCVCVARRAFSVGSIKNLLHDLFFYNIPSDFSMCNIYSKTGGITHIKHITYTVPYQYVLRRYGCKLNNI